MLPNLYKEGNGCYIPCFFVVLDCVCTSDRVISSALLLVSFLAARASVLSDLSVSLQLLLHSRVSKDPVSQRASDGSDQFLWTNYKPYNFKTINWFYLFVYLFILKWKSIAKVSWKWWIWCLHYVTSLLKPCDSFLWESDQNVSYLLSLGIQPDFLWHTHESKMLLENAALNWLFINRSN